MHESIENVLEMPAQVKIGILCGTIALIGGLFWWFMYMPVSEELVTAQEEIDTLKLQIAEKVGIAANLDKFEDEVSRLDKELERALRELPDKKEIDQLLDRISDKARDAGLEIQLFQPQGERIQDFYAEVPVELEVSGTYHELASFFDEIAHLSRVVNVQDFTMDKPKKAPAGVMLDTRVVVTSFRFLDESERPDTDKKGKKRRRKKRGN